mmetsp:Transcript_32222/g.96599  ORF Transcript_32222/g.96599 Transcript_32222/m.96599 type:complete len:272 (+) Transcript_32222:655-1470(+)
MDEHVQTLERFLGSVLPVAITLVVAAVIVAVVVSGIIPPLRRPSLLPQRAVRPIPQFPHLQCAELDRHGSGRRRRRPLPHGCLEGFDRALHLLRRRKGDAREFALVEGILERRGDDGRAPPSRIGESTGLLLEHPLPGGGGGGRTITTRSARFVVPSRASAAARVADHRHTVHVAVPLKEGAEEQPRTDSRNGGGVGNEEGGTALSTSPGVGLDEEEGIAPIVGEGDADGEVAPEKGDGFGRSTHYFFRFAGGDSDRVRPRRFVGAEVRGV